jgi:hypothetical protein
MVIGVVGRMLVAGDSRGIEPMWSKNANDP